jgi:hypothetical protein
MRARRTCLVALLCLPLAGCFEDPVREHVHLELRGMGPVIVTVVQEVAEPEVARNNPALTDRMEESRSTIEADLDPWSRRFALLQPLAERQSIEHLNGSLRRAVHSAALAAFDDAVQLLEADGLTGSLSRSASSVELSLFPTGGSRATTAQRQELERRLAAWSETVAAYLASATELYAHLDPRPDRAVPCLSHIFDTHSGVDGSGPLEPDEGRLVARVKETIDGVVEALLVPDGEAYSTNELSRLVYDPFPARLTVAVKGEVLESEGLQAEAGSFERPAVDAWNALRSLEGRWIYPDLVTALASPAPEDRQPSPDPVAFASIPRSSTNPPDAATVESALLAALVPLPVLTLRWRPQAATENGPGAGHDDWLDLIAAAERGLPD